MYGKVMIFGWLHSRNMAKEMHSAVSHLVGDWLALRHSSDHAHHVIPEISASSTPHTGSSIWPKLHFWRSWTVYTLRPTTSKLPFSSASTCPRPLTWWATTRCSNACRQNSNWQERHSCDSSITLAAGHSSSSSATISYQQPASMSASLNDQ